MRTFSGRVEDRGNHPPHGPIEIWDAPGGTVVRNEKVNGSLVRRSPRFAPQDGGRWYRNDWTVCQSSIRTGRRVMLGFEFLDKRPIITTIAGANGAGKSTFFASHLADCGLRFINADDIALNRGLELQLVPREVKSLLVMPFEYAVQRTIRQSMSTF